MPPFRILSLDGGGIRGAFTAACLAEMEKRLDRPLVEHFDLIAGASTGGIIAAALACGLSAGDILGMYRRHGEKIFTRGGSLWRTGVRQVGTTALHPLLRLKLGRQSEDLFYARYAEEPLALALTEVFGDRVFESIVKTRLIIPAINLANGQPTVFKTPHLPELPRDRKRRVVDILLATTAAPTYFPVAVIEPGTAYCDGGLWANNPGVAAYAEAIKISEKCRRPELDPVFSVEDIHILSVGTGLQDYSGMPPERDIGLLWWGPRILDIMFAAQAQAATFELIYLLTPNRFHRIDFKTPDTSWTLDGVAHLDALIARGERLCHERFDDLARAFFTRPTTPYVAFP
jgi:patatin-like phospholipase/acyl hydrolase